VVEWLAHGQPVITTARSETGAELVACQRAVGVQACDAEALAAAILRAAADPVPLRDAASRGRAWALAERSFAATAAPLRAWCREPRFAGDQSGARFVRLGLLSHPETSAEMLEAYVAGLPVREIVRRGLRWLMRRAGKAIRTVLFVRGADSRARPGEERGPSNTAARKFRAPRWRW
jgi:hypothetical protein